jgi:hypothetical protein
MSDSKYSGEILSDVDEIEELHEYGEIGMALNEEPMHGNKRSRDESSSSSDLIVPVPANSPWKKLETRNKALLYANDRNQAEAKEPDAKAEAVKHATVETRRVVHVLETKEDTAANRYIKHLHDEIATIENILKRFPEPDGTGTLTMSLRTKYFELIDALDKQGKKMKTSLYAYGI